MSKNAYLTNLLGAFATSVSAGIEQEISKLGGRSLSHESALVTIRNHPSDSIDVLSKVLGLTHSGAVRLINTLEQEKLVERHRNLDDGRSVVLRLTASGRKRADKVLHAREQVTAKVLDSLTASQQQALGPVLEAALNQITDGEEAARRICRLCDEGVCRSKGCPVERAAIPKSLRRS
ncbi:MarR family winged helix-turn-helix transcriptional regulator [Pelagibius sp. Alg239-R121]|uniref:MarR family winged helix-turn-helix transcriptional regulator n=1 Tax=Pelagibius sp. Alg239-R121 TaxID=2993448 RepID=UPI0024A65D9D|nr:MarR family transcriptional regulator [Pelagibius sp. Alg239-R121]